MLPGPELVEDQSKKIAAQRRKFHCKLRDITSLRSRRSRGTSARDKNTPAGDSQIVMLKPKAVRRAVSWSSRSISSGPFEQDAHSRTWPQDQRLKILPVPLSSEIKERANKVHGRWARISEYFFSSEFKESNQNFGDQNDPATQKAANIRSAARVSTENTESSRLYV